MLNSHPLTILAQTADGAAGQALYELSRLREFDDLRLPLAVLAVIMRSLVGVIVVLYRRDTAELPGPIGVGMALLRLVALAGLVVYFLGIERRTTREVVPQFPSRLAGRRQPKYGAGGQRRSQRRKFQESFDRSRNGAHRWAADCRLAHKHDVNIVRLRSRS